MPIPLRINSLLRKFVTSKFLASTSRRRARFSRDNPAIECLENRTLLSGVTDVVAATTAVIADSASPVESVDSADYFVATTGSNANLGTAANPFASIEYALSRVTAGDTIIVQDGVYHETLSTDTAGTASARITLKAANPGAVTVTKSGRTFNISHPYYTVEGLIFDGQFGASDIIRVNSNADDLIFRNNEVRFGARDGIDMVAPQNVLIEDTRIHHLLYFVDGVRDDAHGIVTEGVQNLTIRNTEIYYVSGDGLQLQYDGWDNVLVVDSHFWNGQLTESYAGAPQGVYPGEDGIDTKQEGTVPRGHLTVRNSVFHGWRSDYISTPAALNLKHNVDVIVDGNTFYDNVVALRLRGPGSRPGAHVTVMNNVFHTNDVAVRYEDQIEQLRVLNNTFGLDNDRFFQSAGGAGSGSQVYNNLFAASTKPDEAGHISNRTADTEQFVDAPNHDYHLLPQSPAIDAGIVLTPVTTDKDGLSRPQGAAFDVGAYEFDGPANFAPRVIDDSDATGYSLVGNWVQYTGQGLNNNLDYAAKGSGTNTATWTFSDIPDGSYRVYATWTANRNRADNAPFTVYDGSTSLTTVSVNQKLAPVDLPNTAGADWHLLGTFEINNGSVAVRLSNAANGYVIADAIRLEQVGQAPPTDNSRVIDDSDPTGYNTTGEWVHYLGQGLYTSVDYAAAGNGTSTANWTFSDLVPGNYRVFATWTPLSNRATDAPYTVLDGTSVLQTLAVNQELAPADLLNTDGADWKDLGTFEINSGTLIVRLTNAANEYVIADAIRIERVTTAPPAPTSQVIDDSSLTGYSLAGNWVQFTGQGLHNNLDYAAKGTGTSTATWTFSDLQPGTYRVFATWTPLSNRATNAPYAILDDNTLLQTASVNQELAPTDLLNTDGADWKQLGTFTIGSGILRVRLSNAADEYVIADAIRIERVE